MTTITVNAYPVGTLCRLVPSIGQPISFDGKITRVVIHENDRVAYSFLFRGSNCEVHGVPSEYIVVATVSLADAG